eukprot:COSAG02_NODE_40108_length_409_cov_0.822581_2_plen_69_part_01
MSHALCVRARACVCQPPERVLRARRLEDVIRSNGTLSMANISGTMDSSLAMGFWWHKQPADGFYCIYRK